MTVAPSGFEQIAGSVAQRAGSILDSLVTVVDAAGTTVALGGPVGSLRPLPSRGGVDGGFLRVATVIDGHPCELLVSPSSGGETVPPRLVRAVIELVLGQAAIVERLPHQAELRNQFVHRLLRGEVDDETTIRREGQILGIDLTRPRAVMLINAASYILGDTAPETDQPGAERISASRRHRIIAAVVRFFKLPTDAICAYIGDGELAVLKASTSQDLAVWAGGENGWPSTPSWANLSALRRAATELVQGLHADISPKISVGIGRYHPGIGGLAHSYEDARLALFLGQRYQPDFQVHSLDQLGIAAFIGIPDEQTKRDLAQHLLSPLDQEPELLETLACYFAEDCSPAACAARIPIHRNTLTYRLEKIASLTGLDPRRFDEAVQIRLALLLRSR